MARPKRQPDLIDGEQPAETVSEATKRVQITHYKVVTSMGRLIQGQKEYLPLAEADELIAAGQATPCL
jgi:hypothetical protein